MIEVIIDGVTYIPEPLESSLENSKDVLDLIFYSDDLGKQLSIRDYLKTLLCTLWEEGESFSGKRPFGNSGWQYDVYKVLIKEGIIEGTLDIDGEYIEKLNETQASKFVLDLIKGL